MNSEQAVPESPLDGVLAEFAQSLEADAPLSNAELLTRRQVLIDKHPELADALRAYFTDQDAIQHLFSAGPDTEYFPQPALAPAQGELLGYLGDYQILQRLAHGGMGIVYKARQMTLDRIVAIKLIRGGQPTSARERFRREALTMAALEHEHIVGIHEVQEHNGWPYFSMEFLAGGSLADKLRTGPLPPRAAATAMLKIAQAVSYAHERGVLHRDLKPANILLDEAGEPHVTDFGLALQLQTSSELSATGPMPGTPAYMSPEHVRGDKSAISVRSDLFSLGVVLYEMLAGELPFTGATPFEIQQRILHHNPRPLREVNPAIPLDLATICSRCLEKDPQRRLASCRELSDCLADFLANRPIPIRPVSQIERAYRWCRRNPLVAGLGIGLCAAVLVVTWLGWQKTKEARRNGELAIQLDNALKSERDRAIEAEQQKLIAQQQTKLVEQRSADVTRRARIAELENVAEVSQQLGMENPELGALLVAGATEELLRLEAPVPPRVHQQLRAAIDRVSGWPVPGTIAEFSPDGRWLVTLDSRVSVWDVTSPDPTKAPIQSWPTPALHHSSMHPPSLEFSADGNWVLLSGTHEKEWPSEEKLWLWRIDAAQPKPAREVAAIAGEFSPDSSCLATLGREGEIQCLDLTGDPDASLKAWLRVNARDCLVSPTSYANLTTYRPPFAPLAEAIDAGFTTDNAVDPPRANFRGARITFSAEGWNLLVVGNAYRGECVLALVDLRSPHLKSPWSAQSGAYFALSQDKRHLMADLGGSTVTIYPLDDAPLFTQCYVLPRIAVHGIQSVVAFEQRLELASENPVGFEFQDGMNFAMASPLDQIKVYAYLEETNQPPTPASPPPDPAAATATPAAVPAPAAVTTPPRGGAKAPPVVSPTADEEKSPPSNVVSQDIDGIWPYGKRVDEDFVRRLIKPRDIVKWRSSYGFAPTFEESIEFEEGVEPVWSRIVDPPRGFPYCWVFSDDRLYLLDTYGPRVREYARFDGLISHPKTSEPRLKVDGVFSDNGRWLAINESSGVRLLDLTVDPVWHLSVVLPRRRVVAFSPDGRSLLTREIGASNEDRNRGRFRLYRVPRDENDPWHAVPTISELPVMARPNYRLNHRASYGDEEFKPGWMWPWDRQINQDGEFGWRPIESHLWASHEILEVNTRAVEDQYPFPHSKSFGFNLGSDDPLSEPAISSLFSSAAAASKNGDWVLYGQDGTVHRKRLRDNLPAEIERKWKAHMPSPGHVTSAISLAPDETWALATVGESATVIDLKTVSSTTALQVPNMPRQGRCFISRDGDILAIGVDSSSGTELRRWSVHRDREGLQITEEPSLTFQQEAWGWAAQGGLVVVFRGQDVQWGSTATSVNVEMTIVGKGKPRVVTGTIPLNETRPWYGRQSSLYAFAVLPRDRLRIAYSFHGRLFTADVAANEPTTEFKPLIASEPVLQSILEDNYGSIHFSPNGQWLALSGERVNWGSFNDAGDETWIWDLQQQASWPVRVSDRQHVMGFSADSRWLVLGKYNTPPTLVSLDFPRLISYARRLAGRELTQVERAAFNLSEPGTAIAP